MRDFEAIRDQRLGKIKDQNSHEQVEKDDGGVDHHRVVFLVIFGL